MKKANFYLVTLIAFFLMMASGCANSEDIKDRDSGPRVQEHDSDTSKTVAPAVTANCGDGPICATLDHPEEDCIATFELATAQAGHTENGANPYYDDIHTGFYGYHDLTSEMIPKRNNEGSEPAQLALSCHSRHMKENSDYVLHVRGTGFSSWGAGIGMDWAGPVNPACGPDDAPVEAGRECKRQTTDANPNILVEKIEENPACQTNGVPDPELIKCALYGNKYKTIRDLSAYKGIGFWIARGPDNNISNIKVNFAIPESTRFMRDDSLKEEYRVYGAGLEHFTYADGCSDDKGTNSDKCYDEYTVNVGLPSKTMTWEYKTVLFADLHTAGWGYAPPTPESFPPTESVGLKFQTTGDMQTSQIFDFYIDDIHLIRK